MLESIAIPVAKDAPALEFRLPAELGAPGRGAFLPGLVCCGSDAGLRLIFRSSIPDWRPVPGALLEARLLVPSPGSSLYRGRITECSAEGATWRIGTEPVDMPYGLAKALSAWLIFTAGVSPDAAYRAGYPLRVFRDRLVFRYADSHDDYMRVLELRREAYVRVGKKDASTRPSEMAIAWDRASRILCAFHGETLVASAALGFPMTDEDVLLGETAFPGNRFPGDVPPRRAIFEINRLCMHRAYRGGDVREAFFEHIAKIFLESGRDWIYCVSERSLKPMYLSIGFSDTGARGTFLGKEHHLLRLGRPALLCGKGLSQRAWSDCYGAVVIHLLARGRLRPEAGYYPRLAARLAAHRFSLMRGRREEENEFRKQLSKKSGK